MLSFLLIFLYGFLLLLLLFRITRADRPTLSRGFLTAAFVVKILFGLVYGFLFLRFYHGDDTWMYHQTSLEEYHKLLHDPVLFMKDTFMKTRGSMSMEASYDTTNSFWSDFEEVLFIRMLVLFDIFSFGHYYVNVVLFCFITLLGHLLLYRLLVKYYPAAALPLSLMIFFYPVVLFWLSGIRKEGLLFLGVAGALYYFDKLLRSKGSAIKNGVVFAGCMIMLWLIRNLTVLCLAPALLAWFISVKGRIAAWRAFIPVYLLSGFLFFMGGSLPGLPDFAQKVTERQYSFLDLKGNTRLPLDSLHGNAASFLHVLPQALNHSFLQPLLFESKSILQIVSAMDIFLFFASLGVGFFFRKHSWRVALSDPLILACLFAAFSGYLIIGYIVPFPGAFVRYKSIFELLFVACFMVTTDFAAGLKIIKKSI